MTGSLILTVFLDLEDRGGGFLCGAVFFSNVGKNMLFNPIAQTLGCASYVARITLARKFINKRGGKLCIENFAFNCIELHNIVKIFEDYIKPTQIIMKGFVDKEHDRLQLF